MTWLAKTARHVAVVLSLTIVASLALGSAAAAWEVRVNDWIYYGLQDLVGRQLVRNWVACLQGSFVLFFGFHTFRRLIAIRYEDKKANHYLSLVSSVIFGVMLSYTGLSPRR
jgi:hypothetical protein